MIFDIVFEPNPVLHTVGTLLEPKSITSRETQKFIKDMVETMHIKDGVGLAAPQVGESLQLCTIAKQYNDYSPHEDLCLINAHWEKLSREQEWDEEGCLSVPGWFGKIKRYTKIKVTALDIKGKPIEFIAEDFFARIIQHELDHLNGHLYVENAKDLREVARNKRISKYPRD